jgi:serine protease Do
MRRSLWLVSASGRDLLVLLVAALPQPSVAAAGLSPAACADGLPDVVAKVINGVVNIRTTDAHQTRQQDTTATSNDFFSLFAGTVARESAQKSEPGVGRSLGSGFFFGSKETIVTNLHVVKDAASIVVFATDLSVYRSAEVLAVDPAMDLALLRIKPVSGAQVLQFGQSDRLRLGERVFAIGNPFGYGNTVTSGILSGKERSVGRGALSFLLQTDVPMNPGNSGGPLFNMRGEVVGINTANVIGAQGISFAIPGEMARLRLESLLQTGESVQSWIGLYADDILDNPQFEIRSYGVAVRSVVRGSPANRGGLQQGDVIRKLDGEPISHLAELERAVRMMGVGRAVQIEVYRAGRTHVFRLQTAIRPAEFRQSTDWSLL